MEPELSTNLSARLRSALNPPGSRPWLRLVPDDGWFTVILLAVVVFTTIASIESVNWAQGFPLDALTWATLAGLVLSYLVVQQGRLPVPLAHTIAVVLGIVFAFRQTEESLLGGDWRSLLYHTQIWFQRAVLDHQSSTDNYVFVLFLAILSFLLSYITVWLVLHTRRPWLAALANGVVLLINLGYATDDKAVIFMVAFLLSTLLLLVRFTLAENIRVWRARGLRFSSDLGWDFMQAGAIFAVIVLLLAYLLPAGSANQQILDFWNSPNNPWQGVQLVVQRLFYGAGGDKGGPGGSFGFFGSNLQLKGKVTLPDYEILRYKVGPSDDPYQYLVAETFDTYDGERNWTQSSTALQQFAAGQTIPTSAPPGTYGTDTYNITLTSLPSASLIFAPGVEGYSFSIPTQIFTGDSFHDSVGYAAASGTQITPGFSYTVTGTVSNATIKQLEAVNYPVNVPPDQRDALYPSGLRPYMDTHGLSQAVADKAREVTAGAKNMYDAAVDIESYLRTFEYSTDNPEPPAGQDAIAHFLTIKRGFCTDFASAMAMMGRSLGMPTRIALGFTNGTYDKNSKSYIVKGTAAHVWTQIYFAGWGWINFEPTSSFSVFSRATESGTGATATPAGTNTGAGASATPKGPHDTPDQNGTGPVRQQQPANPILVGAGISLALVIALVLLAAALFLLWWRLLFRGLSPVSSALAKVARLGAWAGAPPRRSQTPSEYGDELASVVPEQRPALRDLSELYARDRWGGGLPPEDAARLPAIYDEVRSSLTPIIARRVRRGPRTVLHRVRRRRAHARDEARVR